MFAEDDLLPLSALQHLLFCERQCALIHIEQLWAENPLTLEGEHMHEKAHESGTPEARGDLRITRGMALRSLRLGLSGKSDVIEFRRLVREEGGKAGCEISGVAGRWQPFPLEYKRGKPKRNHCDEVQLCAQAVCLEEMLDCSIPSGALFYGQTRRRFDVSFDAALRRVTEDAACRSHELIRSGVTPRVRKEPKCEQCSLLKLCMPEGNDPGRSASAYLKGAFISDERNRSSAT